MNLYETLTHSNLIKTIEEERIREQGDEEVILKYYEKIKGKVPFVQAVDAIAKEMLPVGFDLDYWKKKVIEILKNKGIKEGVERPEIMVVIQKRNLVVSDADKGKEVVAKLKELGIISHLSEYYKGQWTPIEDKESTPEQDLIKHIANEEI